MDIYTYRYKCKRWYGNVTGTRNLYLEGSIVPEEAAKKDAKWQCLNDLIVYF